MCTAISWLKTPSLKGLFICIIWDTYLHLVYYGMCTGIVPLNDCLSEWRIYLIYFLFSFTLSFTLFTFVSFFSICKINARSNDQMKDELITVRTRATRRRVPYKWRQVYRNSLVIICILENKTVVKSLVYTSFFAQALTISETLTLKLVDLQKVRQGRGVQFLHCWP